MTLPGQTRNPTPKPLYRWLFFIGLSIMVALRVVFLLPSILDFRNFAFRDLGSFQHVDRLIGLGLRPGVDFGFTYGLLPVLLQHIYFALFGAGYWTTFGILAIYLLAMLAFWTLLCWDIGPSLANFGILLGLSSLMLYIDPWPPTPAHASMELSLAFALYFLLKHRLSLALLIAALGALTIPSLPMALTGLITLVMVWEWWRTPRRTARGLATQLAPAAAGYAGAVSLMAAFFGWRSVLQSLFPLSGTRLYRAMHFGIFGQGRYFWHPPDAHLRYYLLTTAGIWLFCSGLLVVFGCVGMVRLARTGKLQGQALFVVVCCALHLVFVFVAYGNYLSYVYYSFLLTAGVVAGVSGLKDRRLRIGLSCLLLCFGLLSQVTGVRAGRQLWMTESASPTTASLYAPNDFQPEWNSVLSLARNRRVFLLSYGMGAEFFYPEVGTARSWFLMPGLLLPQEDSYVAQQIRSSDVVVEELEVTTRYIDQNREWQTALGEFPVKVSGRYFRIWARDPAVQSELLKTATFHSN
jgi:hypothetical protein